MGGTCIGMKSYRMLTNPSQVGGRGPRRQTLSDVSYTSRNAHKNTRVFILFTFDPALQTLSRVLPSKNVFLLFSKGFQYVIEFAVCFKPRTWLCNTYRGRNKIIFIETNDTKTNITHKWREFHQFNIEKKKTKKISFTTRLERWAEGRRYFNEIGVFAGSFWYFDTHDSRRVLNFTYTHIYF